ncbi:substrate-binding domain-containing protein [Nisaea sp.]|uniref:substrate-binding domain-containing protein n=1 Tax=Nisaea sp. TaxID=2024842 RepID=UPI003B5201E6
MTTPPAFLTVRELADLLRVKERKVYQLAADGEVPCRRVTGKLLFPRQDIEAWIAGDTSAERARDTIPPIPDPDRPAIIAGSHDPLLDWAIRESGAALPTLFDGSLDGLERFGKSEASVAAIHIPEAMGARWNIGAVQALGPARNAVLISWAKRSRGLVLAAGNPLGIESVEDLAGKRLVPRQERAGSQVLFRQLLEREGLDGEAVAWSTPPARTESELGEAVRTGRADAGLGLVSAAGQSGLTFVPLVEEEFDLLVSRKFYFEPPFQALLGFARSALFRDRAAELGGYDISELGRVRDNAP